MSSTIQRPRLGSDQVLRIANDDAVRKYGDLSDFRISIRLLPDGWHVEYEPDTPDEQGGGPHYVIDPVDGTIISKKYYQ
ncbi:MAG TPA: hypothetical protein VKD71_09405 [Gemmataceae bacterium]|nr:hypothetical protein [Gemmataceae bacterium]